MRMAFIGVEFGSTRIKALRVDAGGRVLASGTHDWENRLEDGVWTYGLDTVWAGLRNVFAQLGAALPFDGVEGVGVSAMMHGYLAFDAEGELLVPFRTWRNTTTGAAAAALTELFDFNIPQRWSVAHLYQAILNGEEHVDRIAFITTLAGYVHWKLTGEKVLGVGDASGMFPVRDGAYDPVMVEKFRALTGLDWNAIAPAILPAGARAGVLREPFCGLPAGTPFCPPEGDAGTGMVATNSIAARTGNISAGTSIFAMSVLEKPLSKLYPEIDMVTTPDGLPVAMVHCNSCTGDLDAWVGLFGEACAALGLDVPKSALYGVLYGQALQSDADGGGLLAYNLFAGEPVVGLEEGRLLFARRPDSTFTLANFMRTLLFSALGTLAIGMELLDAEGVFPDSMLGHGGLFKTPVVGQRLMAAALGIPVSVMETAGEGGPWGMALLAAYMLRAEGRSLASHLNETVFADAQTVSVSPDAADRAGFLRFLERYKKGLAVERAAIENF
ncbi:MAG: FGGY-family carbohydrate kinase [Clostridiales bacterium]|nr:FGGY-family carbohydrate kinase [Clostridiales bacterium]